MDAQAKNKALFRAKRNAQKQEKQRIDSPLVRYNEHDQSVCRVCDVIVKSESLWPAHQASRKHHEAIEKLKANAAASKRPTNSNPEPSKELPKPKSEANRELSDNSQHPTSVPKRPPSALPPGFFDNEETKRQKYEKDSGNLGGDVSHKKDSMSAKTQVMEGFDSSSFDKPVQRNPEVQASKDLRQVSKTANSVDAKQVKGALPEGFFDSKDADLRARGITPVKPDVKDEYKEFVNLIQPHLQEIDNRLEEEEFDAAETIEEEESVEQRARIERVEMLRRKKLELRASRSVVGAKDSVVKPKESSHEDSSSDDEYNENLTVVWRAKHL